MEASSRVLVLVDVKNLVGFVFSNLVSGIPAPRRLTDFQGGEFEEPGCLLH